MTGLGFLATVLAAACVTFGGCPCVEAVFRHRVDPSVIKALPEVCGMRIVLGNRTIHASDLTTLPPSAVSLLDFQMPDEHLMGHLHSFDAKLPPRSTEPGSSSEWLVRIGDHAVGALISPRHVITMAPCLNPYKRPFPLGYNSFTVQFSGQQIPTVNVQGEMTFGIRFNIAVVTLAEHNVTKVSPVCVGSYNAGVPATAVTWNEKDALPQEHPVTVYPKSHCNLYRIRDDYTLCTSRGPMMCGSPLVQVDNGRWALVGLGTGVVGDVAKYHRLGPTRKWLEHFFLEYF